MIDTAKDPIEPLSSLLFLDWTDPTSGVISRVLSRRVAPVQQSFYFTNSSMAVNGRWLWFYCAFPPAGDAYQGRLLGVADFQQVRYFPETQFSDGSPHVDAQTGEAWWISGLQIWKRSPATEATAILVNTIPPEIALNRRPLRIATHLTRSADGKHFNIDTQIGNEWFVGDIGVDATQPLQIWQRFDRCYNHAQFSPTDPDLLLIAQDFWFDPVTGHRNGIDDRLWLIRRGEQARPIFPGNPSALRGHEWWDADGAHVWYIHYGSGTHRVNIETGREEIVWPGKQIHSHCDRAGRYFVGDFNPGSDSCRVAFYNRITGKTIDIAGSMPPPSATQIPYHVHPHPQFCCGDQFICYTTNVKGTVDVAIADVRQLVDLTS